MKDPMFPAILLGGPPHSGKSTLSYRLSKALRDRSIQHFVLRASPDGEGNWTYEGAPELVRVLRDRAKKGWTPEFAALVSRAVANRHLPLLVDAGGKDSPETRLIAATCTHAILIASEKREQELETWREIAAQGNLNLVADLRSDLDGPSRIADDGPILRGVVDNLAQERGPSGLCFDELVSRVAAIFDYSTEEVIHLHRRAVDDALFLDVARPLPPLPTRLPNVRWRPEELHGLTDAIRRDQVVAIYGVGPLWLYAALAAANMPAPCYIFNVALGWVTPPPLKVGDTTDSALSWTEEPLAAGGVHVRVDVRDGYLDYREANDLIVPTIRPGVGIALDGRLPNWLYAALARFYPSAPWIAVREAPHSHAVVIRSSDDSLPLGTLISLPAE